MSRVIHTRIKDSILVGCIDVLDSVGIKHESMPMSSVVSKVLSAFIESQRRMEVIPTYSSDQLHTRLAEVFPSNAVDMPKSDISLEDFQTAEKPEEKEKIGDKVEAMINEKSTADIQTPFELYETPTEIARDRVTRDMILNAPNLRSWDNLKDEAPKDVLIETADAADDDDMRLAIRSTYSATPTSLWGTPQVRSIVTKIYDDIKDG